MRSPRAQLLGNSPTFDIFSELELTRQSLKKRDFILNVTFLPLSPSSMPKLANNYGGGRSEDPGAMLNSEKLLGTRL